MSNERDVKLEEVVEAASLWPGACELLLTALSTSLGHYRRSSGAYQDPPPPISQPPLVLTSLLTAYTCLQRMSHACEGNCCNRHRDLTSRGLTAVCTPFPRHLWPTTSDQADQKDFAGASNLLQQLPPVKALQQRPVLARLTPDALELLHWLFHVRLNARQLQLQPISIQTFHDELQVGTAFGYVKIRQSSLSVHLQPRTTVSGTLSHSAFCLSETCASCRVCL